MPLKRFVSGLAAALSLLLAGAAPAHAGPPVPLLWKVSDADNAIYLLGSFHMLKPDDLPRTAEVDRAFNDASSLLFEVDPAAMTAPASSLPTRSRCVPCGIAPWRPRMRDRKIFTLPASPRSLMTSHADSG